MSSRLHRMTCGAALVALLSLMPQAAPAEELPALGVKLEETTVSGLSSGAYMAGQFQLAHSRIVIGAALIAGGPYGCAESIYADAMWGPGTVFFNASKAVNGCMLDNLKIWGIPDPPRLAARARQLAESGRIDPIDGVLRDRIYLFSGREDRTVVPAIVAAAAEFYAALGIPQSAIKHVTDIPSGHGIVTEEKGQACGRTTQPYVVDCDYDQAGELLKHLLGPLQPRADREAGVLRDFDQKPFVKDLADHSMSGEGAVYVPAECERQSGCRVHIVFHGCAQNRTTVGDTVLTDSGHLRWADTNRLVVLFPQVAQGALNPQGCWDWWGYTGRDYLARSAPQITAVHRMLLRLATRP